MASGTWCVCMVCIYSLNRAVLCLQLIYLLLKLGKCLLQATVARLVPALIKCNAGLSVTGIAALCIAIFCHVLCRVSVQCCQGYWAGSLTEVAADGLHAGVQRAEGRNNSEELPTRRCTAELANSAAFPLVCYHHCAL